MYIHLHYMSLIVIDTVKDNSVLYLVIIFILYENWTYTRIICMHGTAILFSKVMLYNKQWIKLNFLSNSQW